LKYKLHYWFLGDKDFKTLDDLLEFKDYKDKVCKNNALNIFRKIYEPDKKVH
jgi:uncharacterized protein (DUF111 family)